jgi:hypothetical protein
MATRVQKESLLAIAILAGSAGITALSNQLLESGIALCVFSLSLIALRGYLKGD